MTVTEYCNKMKILADEMEAAGKPLGEEELTSYILMGLDMEYNQLVYVVLARVEPISVSDLMVQLLSFEGCLDLWQRRLSVLGELRS